MGATEPTSEDLAAFDQTVRERHGRLLAGDRVASEELFKPVVGKVVKRLERRWRRWRHTDVLYDAAVNAFLDYVDAPERFDPQQSSLVGWLQLAAHRDVVNVYRSGKQRFMYDVAPLSALKARDDSPGSPPARATPIGLSQIAPQPDDAERLDRQAMWGRIMDAFPDKRQREFVWAAFVEQERSSQRLAEILGINHLPPPERRKKVKNARDIARRKLSKIGVEA